MEYNEKPSKYSAGCVARTTGNQVNLSIEVNEMLYPFNVMTRKQYDSLILSHAQYEQWRINLGHVDIAWDKKLELDKLKAQVANHDRGRTEFVTDTINNVQDLLTRYMRRIDALEQQVEEAGLND